jgi:hypothetical protein
MTDIRREHDMAKKPGESPLTNAQRQSRYRERRKRAGLKRQDMWTDQCGFLAQPSPSGAWAAMTLKQMERALAALLTDYEEWEKEVVYAEIMEYARRITKKYEKVIAEVRAIEQAEREKQQPISG